MAFRASACMLSEVLDNLLFFLGNLLLRLWVHCVPFSSTGTFLYGAILGLQARIFYGDTAITVGWGKSSCQNESSSTRDLSLGHTLGGLGCSSELGFLAGCGCAIYSSMCLLSGVLPCFEVTTIKGTLQACQANPSALGEAIRSTGRVSASIYGSCSRSTSLAVSLGILSLSLSTLFVILHSPSQFSTSSSLE